MRKQPSAQVIVLKQSEESVPQFYRCAVRLRARGRVVRSGDPITVYQVMSTVPEGPVLITDTTEFVFAG